MASLGQELKKERELRGISLKEIADSTKISIRLLRALEDDKLDILPGKFFIKGIIRSYAKYLGLEEESVLNMYYEESQLQEQALEDERKKEKRHLVIPKDARKLLQYFILFITFFLVLFSIYYFFLKKEKRVSLEKTQIPDIHQEGKSIPPPPPSFVEESVSEKKEINLEISFIEKTWIQVYADGVLKLDGLKTQGEKVKVKAFEELLIHLGNAGGLTYTLNNKEGKVFGASGAVVKNIKITLDNLQEFFAQEEKI